MVASYQIATTGSVPYYGEKIGAAVAVVCAVVLGCLLASSLAGTRVRTNRSSSMSIGLTSILAILALQVDGYLGPYANRIGIAHQSAGLAAHRALAADPSSSIVAQQLLSAARIARLRIAEGGPLNDGTWYYFLVGKTTYTAEWAEWFADLRGNSTDAEYHTLNFSFVPQLNLVGDDKVAATMIIDHFGVVPRGPFHIFVTPQLRAAIYRGAPAWRRSDILLSLPTVS